MLDKVVAAAVPAIIKEIADWLEGKADKPAYFDALPIPESQKVEARNTAEAAKELAGLT